MGFSTEVGPWGALGFAAAPGWAGSLWEAACLQKQEGENWDDCNRTTVRTKRKENADDEPTLAHVSNARLLHSAGVFVPASRWLWFH